MAKRRANRRGKQRLVSDTCTDGKQSQPETTSRKSSTHEELECQIAAAKATSDIEIQHLLTRVRLLRSYFVEEQLRKPVLQYFKDDLPNVSLVRRNGDKDFDLRWKDDDGNALMMFAGPQADIHASLFQSMSMAYSAARQSFGGYQFSAGTTKTDIVGVDNLQIGNYMTQEPLNTLMLGFPEGLQTPGANSQRLSSIGTTPKSVRLPKPGEVLLSVHGSPLGVYKEDNNMEAIHESEEG